MKLAEQSLDIFQSIEPELNRIAGRRRAHDAGSQVNSWYGRCEEILRGFDEGKYKKMVKISGQLVPLTDDASDNLKAEFAKSVKRYLLRAFSNEVSHATYKEKFLLQLPDNYGSELAVSVEETYIDLLDNIRLSDFISLIKIDVCRSEKMTNTVKQRVAHLTLCSILAYYENLLYIAGDIPIVKNFDGITVPDFFTEGVRGHKTPDIKASLKVLADKETNELVKSSAYLLIQADPSYALEQQVARYLKKFPERLRKKRARVSPPTSTHERSK